VYNTRDGVQLAGGRTSVENLPGVPIVAGGPSSRVPAPTLTPGSRTFSSADLNIRVPVDWRIGPVSAHEFMHSNRNIWSTHISPHVIR